MGKRKLEKIEYIKNKKTRNVTFCKRKKGMLKKAVELSELCAVSVCVLIYDKTRGKCTHFMSDPEDNLLQFFNNENTRDFFSNRNYLELGGRREDLPGPLFAKIENYHESLKAEENSSQPKSLASELSCQNELVMPVQSLRKSSCVGDLNDQKQAIPDGLT